MTTQKVYCSYDEILDLKTSEKKVTVVAIHTPTGNTPHRLFPGFWRQYQKVKYLGASLSLIPAARLPADISQVGYEGGSNPIDMRDLLNPILWHGCHGESLGAVLNQFMNGGPSLNDMVHNMFPTPSTDVYNTETFTAANAIRGDIFEDMYYKALTDNTWAKAHPQKGFRKSGLRPLVYDLGVNMQLQNIESATSRAPIVADYDDTETIYDQPQRSSFGAGTLGPSSGGGSGSTTTNYAGMNFQYPMDGYQFDAQGSSHTVYTARGVQFLTNRLRSLGWLDTWSRIGISNVTLGESEAQAATMYTDQQNASVTSIPYLMMGLILLPPSYLAEQYFRLCIRHRFAFAKYRGFSLALDEYGHDYMESDRTTFNAIPRLGGTSNSKEVKELGNDSGEEGLEEGDNTLV